MTVNSAEMRIVFIGAVDFSRHCLNEVLQAGGNVVALLTLERERQRVHSDFADLAALASSHRIPVYRVGKISAAENVDLIRSLRPDVIFVFGWSQLISREILDIPRLGCIGTHPALLPRNRGRHPLIWALVEGLTESGLTFFYLDAGADSGDILWQQSFSISIDDDAGRLYKKIQCLASRAIAEFLPQLQQGTAPRIPQDHSLATYWRKRCEADGEINWYAPTIESYNLIRALTRPYVGAHSFQAGNRITVWRAALPTGSSRFAGEECEPGMVVAMQSGEIHVRTGDGYLRILEYSSCSNVRLDVSLRLRAHSCVHL